MFAISRRTCLWKKRIKIYINNFRNYVNKSEIISKLDLDPCANTNENYEILFKIITESKNKHIPQKGSLIKGNTKRDMDYQ